jgi:hypothetical protein
MKFIDLEGTNGTVVVEQIVRMRDYNGASFKTVITLSNNQEVYTTKSIQELKEMINAVS